MTRVATISRSAVDAASLLLFSVAAMLLLLLCFQSTDVVFEAIEPGVPELPVLVEPLRGVFEGARFEAARPPLRVAPASDEAGVLQHFQMFRYRRQSHLERSGDLVDGGLARRQPGQDGAPGGIGERGAR